MDAELEARTLYAIRKDNEEVDLVIPNINNLSEGSIVMQTQSTENHIVFQVQKKTKIISQDIAETITIHCLQKNNRFLIPHAEYSRLIAEINKENDDHQRSESYSSSSLDDEGMDRNSEDDSVYAKHQPNKIQSYQHDSENAKLHKKGRGRPKGSKNKKTLMKQEQYKYGNLEKLQQLQQLHCVLSGKIKRGKGRPKGSKNKPKIPAAFIKKQEENVPFAGKRGKGRPKGSKNKIKVSQQMMVSEENKTKRGRGRPPGAKNKPVSSPEVSSVKEQSEQEERAEFKRVEKSTLDEIFCCKKCYQNKLKKQILEGELLFEDGIEEIDDVFSDVGLENKMNLFIQILQEKEIERLEILLEKRNSNFMAFKCPWQVSHAIERTRFEVKTRREFLSQTGKEGIYVLLHDAEIKKEAWWKKIGIQRIIESTPKDSEELIRFILNIPELKEEIYKSVPHVIRSGNTLMAQIILKEMLATPASNNFHYFQEHEDLLLGNLEKLNNYKKYNLIKHNEGSNYCSPIHCAAVTSNPEFLQKLLELFTDVIHCEDSLLRKPVHYASASPSLINLKALVSHGAELREFDRRKMTPLMIACYYGFAENVEYILEKVRDHSYINFRSDEGYSALHYAILQGHLECVDILINDPFIKIEYDSKDTPDVFHLVGMTGNMQILDKLLSKWAHYLPNSYDRYKKTPVMYAIRNNNNDVMYKLLVEGCKYNKTDTSINSLLHYAAAYGNVEAILMLKGEINQSKNKRNYYPWEFAIMKGHLGCAKLLEDGCMEFKSDPLELILTNIRGTEDYFQCVKYIAQKITMNILFQNSNGNSYLHIVCSLNEEEYMRQRSLEVNKSQQEIREEFNKIMHFLIDYLKKRSLNGYIENKKRESPLKLCIENVNLIGIQKLLTKKISFDLESAEGSTILHRISNLACKGLEEMQFMEDKLRETSTNDLKVNLKKIDQVGFDFLLYFVKNFTESIKSTFQKWYKNEIKNGKSQRQAETKAFENFQLFEKKFMNLVTYLTEMGCDVNGQVVDKKTDVSESFKKWGIQHFLMKFPSLRLIKFFKNKIRDFNAENNFGMTPLHLFCKHILDGNLLPVRHISLPEQYQTQNILEYLLANGLNPNTTDGTKSLPILYAAQNNQYKFIMILLKHKSLINQVNSSNQVPLIEIIKNHRNYTIEQIESILKKGAKANWEDMDKRNSLHHLVACSTNFDSSSEVCKLLLDNNAKINSLDKYGRSPIFYCFDPDDEFEDRENPNDKVELLQAMMKIPDINLNILDVYKRSVVHYACKKNYFFSITYLLDQNINIEIMDHEENTPLAICLRYRNLDQAALIIKKGIKYGFINTPESPDGDKKMSYFAYAIKHFLVGICFMLIQTGYPIQKALQEVTNQAFKQTLKAKYIK